jgi:hypothetical protein
MDLVEPFVLGIDDGKDIWSLELFGENNGFDVVDVRCGISYSISFEV